MVDVYDENTLYRFVDGECSPAEELAILQDEQADVALAQRIRDMREANAKIRSAMDAELLSDLRNDIVQAVKTTHEQNSHVPRAVGPRRHIGILVAACLVAAVGLGTAWSHWRISTWQEAMATVASEREAALSLAVQRGLEGYLSGETFELTDSNLDFVAAVRPDETYKSTSGHWCRSFTERFKFEGKEVERKAIACRDRDTKKWKRMQTVINGSIVDSVLVSDFEAM